LDRSTSDFHIVVALPSALLGLIGITKHSSREKMQFIFPNEEIPTSQYITGYVSSTFLFSEQKEAGRGIRKPPPLLD